MAKRKERVEEKVEEKPKKMEGLTMGRVVHFVMPEGDQLHQPAMVVHVYEDDEKLLPQGRVNLRVFTNNENNPEWRPSVDYSEEPIPGTWHWIERA